MNTWLRSVGLLYIRALKRATDWYLLGVFGLLQIIAFSQLVRSHLSSKQFQTILLGGTIAAGILGTAGVIALTLGGSIAPWTGRFYSLWDTGYAKK